MDYSAILAVDAQWGIGKGQKIPWRIPDDMQHFTKTTTGVDRMPANAVIMGRLTWESIPAKSRPLADRYNVVISRATQVDGASAVFPSFEEALAHVKDREIFVMGGARLYNEAFKDPRCKTIYLTRISHDFECDVRVDRIDLDGFPLVETILEGEHQGKPWTITKLGRH